jgi:putative redox protein
MREIKITRVEGKLAQRVEVGPHQLTADEFIDKGGEDLGPNPFEYLAIALGACTALTLRMYSQRKAWPLENADVRILISKEEETSVFARKIYLAGPLDETQKARLLEIANHCPVHKLLTGKIRIETSLFDEKGA